MPSQEKLARMFPRVAPEVPAVAPPEKPEKPKPGWVYAGKVTRVQPGVRRLGEKPKAVIPKGMEPSNQPVRNRSRYLGERPPTSVQREILRKWHARKDRFR